MGASFFVFFLFCFRNATQRRHRRRDVILDIFGRGFFYLFIYLFGRLSVTNESRWPFDVNKYRCLQYICFLLLLFIFQLAPAEKKRNNGSSALAATKNAYDILYCTVYIYNVYKRCESCVLVKMANVCLGRIKSDGANALDARSNTSTLSIKLVAGLLSARLTRNNNAHTNTHTPTAAQKRCNIFFDNNYPLPTACICIYM